MELIVPDVTYDHHERDYNQFIEDLQREITIISQDVSLKRIDIGRSASWPVVLVTIAGLFFLGKAINENLEAWLVMAKKFGSLITHRNAKLIFIEKVNESIFPVSPLSWQHPGSLAHRPDALYLQTYEVNKEVIYIFGIKSTGEVEIKYRLNLSEWMEF